MGDFEMEVVKMRIAGVSPILMHNPAKLMGQEDTGSRKKKYDPREEAIAGLYELPDGQLYMKSDAFREAGIIAAGEFRDFSRKGRASMTRMFSASVVLSTMHCPLFRPDTGEAITSDESDWTVDARRVVLGPGKAVIRGRPLVEDWACDLEFEYDEELIQPDVIAKIRAASGKFPGVGDYRPGKKGPYGKYTVELLNGEVAEEKPARKRRAA